MMWEIVSSEDQDGRLAERIREKTETITSRGYRIRRLRRRTIYVHENLAEISRFSFVKVAKMFLEYAAAGRYPEIPARRWVTRSRV